METIVIVILLGIIVFMLNRFNLRTKKLKQIAQDNLGMPAVISDAPNKLYLDKSGNIFILHNFIPIKLHTLPGVWAPLKKGSGLISSLDDPDKLLFVELAFRFDEEIIQGAKYILRQNQDFTYFLTKM